LHRSLAAVVQRQGTHLMLVGISLIHKALYGTAVALILLLALGWQVEKRRAGKFQGQVISLTAELKRISTAKDEQRPVTQRNIVEAEKGQKRAETVARRIEAAPVSGQCETPAEIMGADL
jgi:cell division protein FtsL